MARSRNSLHSAAPIMVTDSATPDNTLSKGGCGPDQQLASAISAFSTCHVGLETPVREIEERNPIPPATVCSSDGGGLYNRYQEFPLQYEGGVKKYGREVADILRGENCESTFRKYATMIFLVSASVAVYLWTLR